MPRHAAPLQTVERAPAKLNLWLEVFERRPDGRHGLRSLVEPLAWGDAVSVTLCLRPAGAATEVICRCEAEPSLDGPQNLAARAATALLATIPTPARCEIVLHKAIPVGAGLGGGSADAAATLRALARLLGSAAPAPAILARLAARLGADVPFCLQGAAALMEGAGERLTPTRLPPHGVCVVTPAVALSTAEMYARLDAAGDRAPGADRPGRPWTVPASLAALAAEVAARGNAFWKVACAAAPILSPLREALCATGPLAAGLSGSGSALFGLFSTPAEAIAAAETLSSAGHRATGTAYAPPPVT